MGDGSLLDTSPPGNELHIGSFPGVSVVAATEFGIDHPSELPSRFIAAGGARHVYLHAMHSVVDWFAFAQWTDGKLIRSLSLSRERGSILEDIGSPLPFEEPFWSGDYAEEDDESESDLPFSFNPLELGEAALSALFGYQLEGASTANLFEPESVPLARFVRSRPWWRFW